jgi:hypothetical protein
VSKACFRKQTRSKKAKSKRSLLLKGFGLIQWQGQTFKRSENGSPQQYLYSNLKFTYLLI